MSTRVAVMHGGRIAQCAVPVTLYEEPATLEVAEMIGTPKINTLPGTVGPGGRLAVGSVALDAFAEAPERSALTVAVRPEHLALREAGERLAGTVRGLEDLGPELLVRVVLSDPRAEVTLRLPVDQRGRHRVGDLIGLDVRPGRALAFDSAGLRVPLRSRAARALAESAGASR